jgi:hypothetical protein
MIAIVDPPGKPDAVTVGEGHAPVVAVLRASVKNSFERHTFTVFHRSADIGGACCTLDRMAEEAPTGHEAA